MIKLKRVYETPDKDDGLRILVDKIWPRGLTKEKAAIDLWHKEIAPSDALRKWFAHDPSKWEEFKKRYFQELKSKEEQLKVIKERKEKGTVTLVFGAKDEKFNNAVALEEYLRKG